MASMKVNHLKRRELITLFGSAAVWPFAARAQQTDRMRRVAVLMLAPESDPQGKLRASVFQQELEKFGWPIGRNIQIDFQWGLGDADWIRSSAAQLLRMSPDFILAHR